MFEETRDFLKKAGLPAGDLYDLPTSGKTFPDGAHYRIEIPTVNSAEAMRSLLERAEKLGVVINRVDETYGIFRYTREELREMLDMAKAYQLELNLSVGPRATYDTGGTVQTHEGARMGYRLRGMEQIVRSVEDVKRAIDLGCRGILVYDEGLLWLLNEMRKSGELPKETQFKVSAHCGHANPIAFKVLESLGADSANPVRDIQLPMIAAIRKAVSIPIDVHSDNPPSSGGFIRTYEAPEMVRIGSPVHIKSGNSVVSAHGIKTTAENGRRMAEQASIVCEMIQKYYPEATQSKPGGFLKKFEPQPIVRPGLN